ncbi:denn domain-containing [Anaeramoeba flamelloides]|uniref:Denn domain-containing n=1 Tax=Anaeramoeba flamelloides TaxID=1746091 RepID=A0ABQ8YY15_9EUKA|nr:denn domain-containing [Anaeramoeba flamelloides]
MSSSSKPQSPKTVSKKRLITAFVLVSLNEKGPKLEYKYLPKPRATLPLPTITSFCFPDYDPDNPEILEKNNEQAFGTKQNFTFVLTNISVTRSFGFCRRVKINGELKTLCLITDWPWYSLFSDFLDVLERRITLFSPKKQVPPIIRKINKHALPFPGEEFYVQIKSADGLGSTSYRFVRSDSQITSSNQGSFQLDELLGSFRTQQLLEIFSALLFERRILVVSSSLSILSNAIHSLTTLVSPFVWNHVFISVLPKNLIDFASSPMPFLIGIQSQLSKKLEKISMEPHLVVNVEAKSITYEGGLTSDLKKLPAPQLSILEKSLSNAIKQGKKKGKMIPSLVLNPFLDFFLSIFGTYRKYISTKNRSFNFGAFLQSLSEPTAQFLLYFKESQMYADFIRERTDRRNLKTLSTEPFETRAKSGKFTKFLRQEENNWKLKMGKVISQSKEKVLQFKDKMVEKSPQMSTKQMNNNTTSKKRPNRANTNTNTNMMSNTNTKTKTRTRTKTKKHTPKRKKKTTKKTTNNNSNFPIENNSKKESNFPIEEKKSIDNKNKEIEKSQKQEQEKKKENQPKVQKEFSFGDYLNNSETVNITSEKTNILQFNEGINNIIGDNNNNQPKNENKDPFGLFGLLDQKPLKQENNINQEKKNENTSNSLEGLFGTTTETKKNENENMNNKESNSLEGLFATTTLNEKENKNEKENNDDNKQENSLEGFFGTEIKENENTTNNDNKQDDSLEGFFGTTTLNKTENKNEKENNDDNKQENSLEGFFGTEIKENKNINESKQIKSNNKQDDSLEGFFGTTTLNEKENKNEKENNDDNKQENSLEAFFETEIKPTENKEKNQNLNKKSEKNIQNNSIENIFETKNKSNTELTQKQDNSIMNDFFNLEEKNTVEHKPIKKNKQIAFFNSDNLMGIDLANSSKQTNNNNNQNQKEKNNRQEREKLNNKPNSKRSFLNDFNSNSVPIQTTGQTNKNNSNDFSLFESFTNTNNGNNGKNNGGNSNNKTNTSNNMQTNNQQNSFLNFGLDNNIFGQSNTKPIQQKNETSNLNLDFFGNSNSNSSNNNNKIQNTNNTNDSLNLDIFGGFGNTNNTNQTHNNSTNTNKDPFSFGDGNSLF